MVHYLRMKYPTNQRKRQIIVALGIWKLGISWWSVDLGLKLSVLRPGFGPDWGTKIPQAIQCGKEKKMEIYFSLWETP